FSGGFGGSLPRVPLFGGGRMRGDSSLGCPRPPRRCPKSIDGAPPSRDVGIRSFNPSNRRSGCWPARRRLFETFRDRFRCFGLQGFQSSSTPLPSIASDQPPLSVQVES